jgi:2-polyprenyl-3-methyl-5-hydroxy-6-metoxy-1,4-benzoquinol methylase
MRDTDADWHVLAETEPFYWVSTSEEFLSANLDQAAIDRFYASGELDISRVFDKLTCHFGAFEPKSALDFGCGVGRLTFPMARRAASVTGVDIAPAMLAHANKRCEQLRQANVRFQTEMPGDPFDWINSYIVLQHISPGRGLQILRRLLDLLVVGGRISIHLTTSREPSLAVQLLTASEVAFVDEQKLSAYTSELKEPTGKMFMFDYDMNLVLALLRRSGFAELHLVLIDHGGHHGVWILGVKASAISKSLELVHGEEVLFRGDGRGPGFLLDGWSPPEPWGVWSDGSAAKLRFYLSPRPAGKVVLRLRVSGFLPVQSSIRDVDVLIADKLVERWSFDSENPAGERRVVVDQEAFDSNGGLEIGFKILKPESPVQYGLSRDARKLGIGLVSLVAEGENPV